MRTLLRILFGFVYGAVVGLLIGPVAGLVLIYLVAAVGAGTPLGDSPIGWQSVLWLLVASALGAISSSPWAPISRACLVIGAGLSAVITAVYIVVLTAHPRPPGMPVAIPPFYPLILVCPMVSAAAAGAVAAARQESLVEVIMIERP